MMKDLIRETAFGQLVRLATKNRCFQYPEEKPDFVLPTQYQNAISGFWSDETSPPNQEKEDTASPREEAESSITRDDVPEPLDLSRTMTKSSTRPYTAERFEADQAAEAAHTKSASIIPQKTSDGSVLVDWYTTDDGGEFVS